MAGRVVCSAAAEVVTEAGTKVATTASSAGAVACATGAADGIKKIAVVRRRPIFANRQEGNGEHRDRTERHMQAGNASEGARQGTPPRAFLHDRRQLLRAQFALQIGPEFGGRPLSAFDAQQVLNGNFLAGAIVVHLRR